MMFDETVARIRTIKQKERSSGTLIYQDLVEAHNFFGGKCPYSETIIAPKI